MDRRRSSLKSVQRAAGSLVCTIAAFCYIVPAAHSSTANWTQSGVDVFFYPNADSPGTRALAPTFLNALPINSETQQFEPHTANDPARLGTSLFAFDTSSQITSGLPTSRYQINSVTMTATWTYDSDAHRLKYTTTPLTQPQLLSEYASGAVSGQRPMELYGAGLRAGYTGYQFTSGASGPPLLDEITHSYSGPGGSYIAYPIVRKETQPGTILNVDVMNNFTGGYSATEATNTTAPFTATPWAVGTTALAEGAEIPDNTSFTFNLDLNATGVRAYVQESLAAGGLGFFVSTAHTTGQFGAGGGYPRWYLKEAAGFPYAAPAQYLPQLAINYTILPAGVQGDYNGNGVVDAADYVLWRNGGPLQNEVDNPGTVSQQDYVEWRARFGNTAGSGSGLGSNQQVPEPATAALLLIAGVAAAWNRVGRNRG